MAKQGRGSDQAMIRLPEGMRDRIKAAAERNGRSMNAEIVAALEQAYPIVLDQRTFLQIWRKGISIGKTPEERQKILDIANEQARKSGANYRITETRTGDRSIISLF